MEVSKKNRILITFSNDTTEEEISSFLEDVTKHSNVTAHYDINIEGTKVAIHVKKSPKFKSKVKKGTKL